MKISMQQITSGEEEIIIKFREKTYRTGEYLLRQIFWCMAPLVMMVGMGTLFNWFRKTELLQKK